MKDISAMHASSREVYFAPRRYQVQTYEDAQPAGSKTITMPPTPQLTPPATNTTTTISNKQRQQLVAAGCWWSWLLLLRDCSLLLGVAP